jgi:hypothetical protein
MMDLLADGIPQMINYQGVLLDGDGEMSPRKRLVSVGYAYKSLDADTLGGKSPGDFVGSGETGSVTAEMIAPAFISSVDGVANDGGDVDLVAGSNVTITPDDASTIPSGVYFYRIQMGSFQAVRKMVVLE